VLGTKKTVPFEILGSRAVVARLAISLEERLEQVWDNGGMVPTNPQVRIGAISDPVAARVIRSRVGVFRACYQRELQSNPTAQGRLMATIEVEPSGMVTNVSLDGTALDATGTCINRNLRALRFPAGEERSIRAPFIFTL
jgi:hypothetical protein